MKMIFKEIFPQKNPVTYQQYVKVKYRYHFPNKIHSFRVW